MAEPGKCCCTGLRYCRSCFSTERVNKILEGQINFRKPEEVILNQFTKDRTSSCSFLQLAPSSLSLCPNCGIVFDLPRLVENCSDHSLVSPSKLQVEGVFIIKEGVTEEQERFLMECLDKELGWKESQSGRRKLEFGPKRNFKKKKVKLPENVGMPSVLAPLCDIASQFAVEKTEKEFYIAEVSVLDYSANRLSGFDPHVDDTWLWGERIVGANLLSDAVFTFVNSESVSVNVVLPRRSLFMMSGKSRYEWMHGINPCYIKGRRVSITMRELSDEINLQDPEMCEGILRAAKTFV